MCNYVGQGDRSKTTVYVLNPWGSVTSLACLLLATVFASCSKCDESLASGFLSYPAVKPTMYLASLWASHITLRNSEAWKTGQLCWCLPCMLSCKNKLFCFHSLSRIIYFQLFQGCNRFMPWPSSMSWGFFPSILSHQIFFLIWYQSFSYHVCAKDPKCMTSALSAMFLDLIFISLQNSSHE